jgi:hypothetical protein
MHTEFWWRNVKELNYVKQAAVDEKIIIDRMLKKQDWKARTRFIWLRTGKLKRALLHTLMNFRVP